MLRPPKAKNTIRFAVNAKMWYSGSAVITVSRPSSTPGFHTSMHWAMLASRLPSVSAAPLLTPVVPPVYCSEATRSVVAVAT